MHALWMVLAALLFATMGVCVKFASAHFNSAELVFWRGLLGMLLIGGMARVRGVPLRTPHLRMHAWRAVIGVFALGTWFYAIAHLPLATAMTLNSMSSVWIALLFVGGALLVWRPPANGSGTASVQGLLVLTVLCGFAGVLLMLRPTVGSDDAFAGLIGLLSGLSTAFAYLQVMALARVGEPDSRTVFYFALASALAGAAAMPLLGVSRWHWPSALWLLPIGLLASLGQLCMTRAYGRGATLVVANLQYSGIVFAAMYGVLLFEDPITGAGWTGMALIVASGIAATALRERAAPPPPRIGPR